MIKLVWFNKNQVSFIKNLKLYIFVINMNVIITIYIYIYVSFRTMLVS